MSGAGHCCRISWRPTTRPVSSASTWFAVTCRQRSDLPALTYTDNAEYADTSELVSLAKALDADSDDGMDLYVSYGDVIFNRYILDTLGESDDDITIVADTDWRESVNRGRAADYVTCTLPHSRRTFYQPSYLERAAEDLPEERIHGEWMGFLRVTVAALPRDGGKAGRHAGQSPGQAAPPADDAR